MAYQSRKTNNTNNQGKSSASSGSNNQKYAANFKDNLKDKLENAAQKQLANNSSLYNAYMNHQQNKQKKQDKKELKSNISKYATPSIASEVKRNLLFNTSKGDKYLKKFKESDSPKSGVANVQKEVIKDKIKKRLILISLPFLGVIIFLVLLIALIFKNADTQIYSNENEGTVESEFYGYEEKEINIFKNYPGLYEKVEANVKKISDKYKVEVDRYLILATLIAPIENGLIIPVDDGSCGEKDCYYLDDKSYTWTEFLKVWGDQSEYLAKAQILTYVNESSGINVSCGSEDTMEQYAKNDLTVNEFNFWKIFNPVNWFTGFRNVTDAELNAKCVDPPKGKSKIPTVYVLSKDRGTYYNSIDKNGNPTYEKDPNTGGVYFWNLVNKGGFIHTYLKDYLSREYENDEDKNYELNLSQILDVANYIYSYYESLRKDCEGFTGINKSYNVIESTIEKINVKEKNGTVNVIDFEDQYVGGVILAEFGSANDDAMLAFAILARTEAIAIVGLDGSGTIENSSNAQNYNPNYSPEKYPRIAEIVAKTRGLVLTHYNEAKVWHTEYDAFCPVKKELENGFYYLPDGQRNLPISPSAYEAKAHKTFINSDSRYLRCPCFQSNSDQPNGEESYTESPSVFPTGMLGKPAQMLNDELCWNKTSETRVVNGVTQYKWKYHATGGHGRGASQYGLDYFGYFEYDWNALLKLFFDGASVRRLSSSLEDGECASTPMYTGSDLKPTSTYSSSADSNYTETVSGSPLNMSLPDALAKNNYTVDDLNKCIGDRVTEKGMHTRAGVVEAGMSLLECTMNMTNGYTYPYDHNGGKVGGNYNPDLTGKLGVNSRWGELSGLATGCQDAQCRLGLNCANFVRWSMCNGGMDLCSRGSAFAAEMSDVSGNDNFYPGKIRIRLGKSYEAIDDKPISELSSNYQSILSNYNSSQMLSSVSKSDAIKLIQPGDVLFSNSGAGTAHTMLIVGVNQDGIMIAENGRKTRKISNSDLLGSTKTGYIVVLLDDYYANDANANNLSW